MTSQNQTATRLHGYEANALATAVWNEEAEQADILPRYYGDVAESLIEKGLAQVAFRGPNVVVIVTDAGALLDQEGIVTTEAGTFTTRD